MIKYVITGVAAAAIALGSAGVASADDAPKPPPLSAAGLGIKAPELSAKGLGLKIPELSAAGLFNHGKPFTYPPLSAGGICHYVFRGTTKQCGKVPD